ncbi:MAG: alpha/beta hydrolase family protein [Clostridium sp.]|nr:alpha/beta hydrolase family protein [Clostridium sp.]
MEQRYSYKNFFKNLYKNMEQAYVFKARTLEEADKWKTDLRRAVRETLGINRLETLNLKWQEEKSKKSEKEAENTANNKVKLMESVKEEGYTRRKYLLETLPEVYMPFYMLVPDGVSEKNSGKGMIAIPAHGANKEVVAGTFSSEAVKEKLRKTPKEAYGLEFVKRGYVVFCPDPPGYGERMEPVAKEESAFTPDFRQDPLGCSCKNLALTAEALGLSLMGLEVWDLLCLLDFAAACPEVDSEKIGCAGFSGGGQYTMWLAALDDRIKTAVVSGYVHGYFDSLLDVHLCSCNYAPGLWKLGDISDFCSLIAPRPLFVENGIQDPENGFRGIDGPKEQVERIRQAYRLYGKEENLRHVTPEGTHMWYGECFDFVEKVMG